jgi:transposase
VRPPKFVRPLTDAEREALAAGLRSADAFTLRRCQILLASARGERAPRIAAQLGCDDQTVLDVIDAFHARGLACLTRRAPRGAPPPVAFSPAAAERLRALLHERPRAFGRETSLWTLDLAAEVSFEQGLTASRVSGETVRATLARLGLKWKRAKRWLTSPDPEYARKKANATV